MLSPWDWLRAIISGSVDGSRRNWQNAEEVETRILIMNWWRKGFVADFVSHVERNLTLEFSREEQFISICSRSSTTPVHVGARQNPLGLLDQWRHSFSVRNLPESILACTQALFTSYGELPAVVHSG